MYHVCVLFELFNGQKAVKINQLYMLFVWTKTIINIKRKVLLCVCIGLVNCENQSHTSTDATFLTNMIIFA